MPPFASAVTDAISIHAPHARSDAGITIKVVM